eukprot:TRINITY_DN1170_c0_g1_i2.p1 TRINITY_DN1170_c0_g1~~TRINITY_DN1170_c0_g1_i2.p1  ORF type:complete len:134 (+),score=14.16 TRINITY_DN1170_c0_g1_i2:107-508(+)
MDPFYIFNRYLRQFPVRPWNIFFELNRFGVPDSLSKAIERLETNLQYFLTNYLIVNLILFTYCAYTNLYFLITSTILCFIWLYLLAARDVPDDGIDLRRQGINFRLSGYQLFTSLTICDFFFDSFKLKHHCSY